MKKGTKVRISDEAVFDSELSSNEGIIVKLWNEPLANSEDTPLVEIKLKDGSLGVVGQHEVTVEDY